MNPTVSCVTESPVLVNCRRGRTLMSMLGDLYCKVFHDAISRPVEGKYRCWKCLREFELDW